MPELLEHKEAMGSPEVHLAVMKNRVDSAQADYDRAVTKGFVAQIETAKERLEESQREYKSFMAGGLDQDKDSKTKTATAVH